MKQFLITLLFAGLFGSNAMASEDPISSPVLRAFQKTFTSAKEVSWTTGEDVFVVRFQYNNQYITAYYANNGEMLVMSKNILSNQLPIMLEAGLKEHYAGYWITNVVELSGTEEVSYYVALENADQTVILKSSGGSWNVHSKTSK